MILRIAKLRAIGEIPTKLHDKKTCASIVFVGYLRKGFSPCAKFIQDRSKRPNIDLVGVRRNSCFAKNNFRSKIMERSTLVVRRNEIFRGSSGRYPKVRNFPDNKMRVAVSSDYCTNYQKNRAGDTVRGLEVPVDDSAFVDLSKARRNLLNDLPYDQWPRRFGGSCGIHFLDVVKKSPFAQFHIN